MQILLDLDGTTILWHRAVYNYCVAFSKEERSYEQFWREYRTFPKEFWSITELPDLYTQVFPSQDVLDTLNYLDKNGHTLYYATHRPQCSHRVTQRYLDKWFPQSMNLTFTHDKANYARLWKIDIAVDDREDIAKELKYICKVLLIKQPWNEGYREGFTTIDRLSDIKEYLC